MTAGELLDVITVFRNYERQKVIGEVMAIIHEDIGEHIYRDAFRSREDLKILYDQVKTHILTLKEE